MTVPVEWLRALAAAGRGPLGIAAVRGEALTRTITISADLTDSVMAGSIRTSPDAATALVDFAITLPTVTAGISTFTLSLTAEQVDTLPADTAARGVIELPWAVRLTMPEYEEATLVGGVFTLAGRV